MNILFLSTRAAKPSFRFRVEQVLPFFRERGHAVEVCFLPKTAWGRWSVYRRLSRYDVVFLQKRLLGRAELMLARQRARRLVYDLDDAVMYDNDGTEDSRRRNRFNATCRAADLVVCGNAYLNEQAALAGGRTALVPTAIDTARFHPRLRVPRVEKLVTIGWTGSRATNAYLNAVFPVLANFAGRVQMKILSDTAAGINFSLLKAVPYRFVPWSPEVEVTKTASFDIGIMPLPDDPWSRGKCGFKALQYMALGVPAVLSPVGVNRDIVHDGLDGFLAGTRDEWHQALARLIRDRALRETLGQAGRRRIEQEFALDVIGPRLVDVVESVRAEVRQSA